MRLIKEIEKLLECELVTKVSSEEAILLRENKKYKIIDIDGINILYYADAHIILDDDHYEEILRGSK